MNFTWWVNREDPDAERTCSWADFIGLDNIGIFDRSAAAADEAAANRTNPTRRVGCAVYALDMMAIALELAQHNRESYEDIASKFFEHFLYIATRDECEADENGARTLGRSRRLLLRSSLQCRTTADVITRCACVRSSGCTPLLRGRDAPRRRSLDRLPNFKRREWIGSSPTVRNSAATLRAWPAERTSIRTAACSPIIDSATDYGSLLTRSCLNESEFLSDQRHPGGLEISHADHPVVDQSRRSANIRDGLRARRIHVADFSAAIRTGAGPIWFPLNFLFIEALQNFHFFYGDDYQSRVSRPVPGESSSRSGTIATELSHRLACDLFLVRASDGTTAVQRRRREIYEHDREFQIRSCFFNEYFQRATTGAGLGASHQTGWTGLVAKLVQQMSEYEGTGRSPLDWHYDASPGDEVIVPEVFTRS